MISIIIPIFNVEKYIVQCVDSVLNQTYKDFEIILVDDGSSDNCPHICDEYAKNDLRIKVIHKANGGLSDARNAGMKICKGDYLMFLDGDDYWDSDCLYNINNVIENRKNVDVIITGGYSSLLPKGTISSHPYGFQESNIKFHNGEDALKYLFSYVNSNGEVWSWSACWNVYRTELLLSNKLFFKKGIICEDAEWTPRVILSATNFALCSQLFYMYRLNRPNSIMNTYSLKKLNDYFEIVENWICFADNIENQELALIIKQRYSNNYFYYLTYVYFFNKEERQSLISKFEKGRFIKYVSDSKNAMKVKAILNFGYKPTLKIMNLKYRIKENIKKLLINLSVIDR